jgi:hypothetical protein
MIPCPVETASREARPDHGAISRLPGSHFWRLLSEPAAEGVETVPERSQALSKTAALLVEPSVMKKLLASTLVGAAVLAAAPSARAGDFVPAFAANRAGGFIDIWPAENSFALWFGAELQLRVARKVFLDMSFSGAYADVDFPPFFQSKQAAYGNPTFGAHYADEVNSSFAFYVGGSLTPPLLLDPDGDVAFAAAYAAPMRGYYDADRFAVGAFALRGAFGLQWEIVRHFYLRADVRPVVYIGANDRFSPTRDAAFFLEQAVEIEYRLNNGFGFGARFQGVATLTENDLFQVMFEPFIALSPKMRGFYLRLGFPLALDEPLGFGLDNNKVATVRLSLGGQW